jgi:hypothetical protein
MPHLVQTGAVQALRTLSGMRTVCLASTCLQQRGRDSASPPRAAAPTVGGRLRVVAHLQCSHLPQYDILHVVSFLTLLHQEYQTSNDPDRDNGLLWLAIC